MQVGDIVRFVRRDVDGIQEGPGPTLHRGDVGVIVSDRTGTGNEGYFWVDFPLLNEYFLPTIFLEKVGEVNDGSAR
jgi:hypothetical protein